MEGLKRKILERIKQKGLTGDIFIERDKKTELTVNDGTLEKIVNADSFGAGIRVFKNGKMGFSFFTTADEKEAIKMVDAAETSALIEGYENYVLPENTVSAGVKVFDVDLSLLAFEKKKQTALTIEKEVKASGKNIKFARDTTYGDNIISAWYANTSGADYVFEKTYCFAYTSAVASNGKEDEVVEGMTGGCGFAEKDFSLMAQDAGKRAEAMLGGISVKSGNYKLILPPYTAVQFLQVLSGMFLASASRKGKSLLSKYTLGDKLGSKIVTLRDDALLDYKMGSYNFDGEGTKGENKALIENGVFKGLLYDVLNAGYMNTKSTGNCTRASYKAMPEPGTSNFYIPAGESKVEDMARKASGIFVNSLMGLHTVDQVSGNFSLGINGWLMKDGAVVHPVKTALISGNIKTLLESISCICDDLKFYANFGSPTLIVNDILVAGKE